VLQFCIGAIVALSMGELIGLNRYRKEDKGECYLKDGLPSDSAIFWVLQWLFN